MNSQTGSRIAGINAREAVRASELRQEPRVPIELPLSMVLQFAEVKAPAPFTIEYGSMLAEASRTWLKENRGFNK